MSQRTTEHRATAREVSLEPISRAIGPVGAPAPRRFGSTLATGATILVALAACSLLGCFEDGVTLPTDFNTLKYREIEIQYTQSPKAPYGDVRALNGVHGSPLHVVPGDANLKSLYWARSCNPNEDPSC
ncbi:MAG: hypothetical protein QF464_22570, partial [Myxococcota bacterium]|nr:hypothetical protein [Myxococcota bacterium]